jgi:hypothetical protein
VLRVNGAPVRGLRHLAEAIVNAPADDEWLRLDCEYDEVIVVSRAHVAERTAAVLETHGVPAAMSPDLAEVLGVWPPPKSAAPAARKRRTTTSAKTASKAAAKAAAAAAS